MTMECAATFRTKPTAQTMVNIARDGSWYSGPPIGGLKYHDLLAATASARERARRGVAPTIAKPAAEVGELGERWRAADRSGARRSRRGLWTAEGEAAGAAVRTTADVAVAQILLLKLIVQ